MRALLVFSTALFALASSAQSIPTSFPTPGESLEDRNTRDLEEQALPFLSRLYAESSVAASPAYGDLRPTIATVLEGGYTFRNGDAISAFGRLETGLVPEPGGPVTDATLGSGIGVQYVLGLGRLAPRVGLAQHAELGLGASTYTGALDGTSVEVSPRYVIETGKPWSYVLGARVRRTVAGGEALGRAWFVGPSVGVRLRYVSPSRMVLRSDEATDAER